MSTNEIEARWLRRSGCEIKGCDCEPISQQLGFAQASRFRLCPRHFREADILFGKDARCLPWKQACIVAAAEQQRYTRGQSSREELRAAMADLVAAECAAADAVVAILAGMSAQAYAPPADPTSTAG